MVPRPGDQRFALAAALIHVTQIHRHRHKAIVPRLLKVTEAFGADFATMIVNAVTETFTNLELESLMATPEMGSWRHRHGLAFAPQNIGSEQDGACDINHFDLDHLIENAQ